MWWQYNNNTRSYTRKQDCQYRYKRYMEPKQTKYFELFFIGAIYYAIIYTFLSISLVKPYNSDIILSFQHFLNRYWIAK